VTSSVEWSRARVNIDYHVAFDANLYSVPYNLVISMEEGKAKVRMDIVALKGDITTGEAVQLANVLEVRRKTIETEEFERRLTEIENRTKPG
jgi:hypothetical protein